MEPSESYKSMSGVRVESPSHWHWLDVSVVPPLTLQHVRDGLHRIPGRRIWEPRIDEPRMAAVVVVVYDVDGEANVAIIERSLRNGLYRGDLAFPGGGIEAGESVEDGALRELREELGIDTVEVVGQLQAFEAVTSGHRIHPVVTAVPARPDFVPDPHEVESIVEVRLRELLDPERMWEEIYGDGQTLVQFFDLGDRGVAWGTTAMILIELLDAALVGAGFSEPPA